MKSIIKGVVASVLVVLVTELFWVVNTPIKYAGLIAYVAIGYFIMGYFHLEERIQKMEQSGRFGGKTNG